METCCTTEECVNQPNDAVFECRRHLSGRACAGWKLEWTDPGPEVKVIHSVVPGPFEGPKILKALPYKVVSKCGRCARQSRRSLRNGIPDPWLEFLEQESRKESREEDGDSGEQKDARLVKKCLRITDFVWHKKGLALLQGIPDPWKTDFPCACEIKEESNNRKKKSHDKKVIRCRSSANERESPRRRSSAHEEDIPRRKSLNEKESLRHQNENHPERFPRPRSTINEEIPRRRSSNKREENTKRISKNDDEEAVRRQRKCEEKYDERAMCFTVEPSKTTHVCYEGFIPACLKDCLVEVHPKRHSKHYFKKSIKCRSKIYDQEPVRRSSKKYGEKIPTKRRTKNLDEELTKCRNINYENDIIEDRPNSCEKLAECRKKYCRERPSKSINKNENKEPTTRCWVTTSEDSRELFVEALKETRKRSDTAKNKVEKGKTSSVKKLRTCGNDFNEVKQRLQELDNELKAKEAAKEIKLREMEQLSKLRKKTCRGNKSSGKVREKLGRQKGKGLLHNPDQLINKIRSTCKESISSKGNYYLNDGEYSVNTDESKTAKVKDLRSSKNSTYCNNKNVGRWLDEPVTHKKKLSKESSKIPKKTEAQVTSRNTRELKTPPTPLKSICKNSRPVTTRPCSPQAAISPCAQPSSLRMRSPCPANSRRVSYIDEPQPTSRSCSPCSPNHRRVSCRDESRPPTSRTSSPCYRRYHAASYVDEPVASRINLSTSPRCTSIHRTSSIACLTESKENVEKFLEEINSRIEITRDALNSPNMRSVAVQPLQEESSRTWRCPGRDLCPRMRERAGADEGSELFIRRARASAATNKAVMDETISKFDEKSVEDCEGSSASDCNAGAEGAYLQRSYRRSSVADFKRRQKEIEELFVESFSERDC